MGHIRAGPLRGQVQAPVRRVPFKDAGAQRRAFPRPIGGGITRFSRSLSAASPNASTAKQAQGPLFPTAVVTQRDGACCGADLMSRRHAR